MCVLPKENEKSIKKIFRIIDWRELDGKFIYNKNDPFEQVTTIRVYHQVVSCVDNDIRKAFSL